MPSKKQQRRRQKLKRHEYEEVYVDEEGNELDPEDSRGARRRASGKEREAGEGREAAPARRGGRTIDPPSWRRTGRRTLLFFPLMLITVFLLAGDEVSTLAEDRPDHRADGVLPAVQLLHGHDGLALCPAPARRATDESKKR